MIGNYQDLYKIINMINDIPIYVAGHNRPDYDSIGSGLALTRFLNQAGKKAYFLLNDKYYQDLAWFGDLTYVTNQVPDADYIFIQLDASRKSRLGKFQPYFDKARYTINIDHHENHLLEANYNFCRKEASSTAEIIYNLLQYFGRPIDNKIASLIYAGIVTDTYSFTQRTSSDTFKIASSLSKLGINTRQITKDCFLDKTMHEINILVDMLSRIKYDEFHYIIMDRQEELYKDASFNTIFRKAIPTIQNIKDIDLIVLILIDGQIINGNIRSNTELEVGDLIGKLGGGGHKKSGNFVNNLSLEANINIIKDYLKSNSKGAIYE